MYVISEKQLSFLKYSQIPISNMILLLWKTSSLCILRINKEVLLIAFIYYPVEI